MPAKNHVAYLVEHMEPGEAVSRWAGLEYAHMGKIVDPRRLIFTNYPANEDAAATPAPLEVEQSAFRAAVDRSLPTTTDHSLGPTALPASPRHQPLRLRHPFACLSGCLPDPDRVCLLDMDATQDLSPFDVDNFDLLVLGGILGNVLVLDDGTYGSDDRTGEIRGQFRHRRRLGGMQMTTDTALLVTRLVLEDGLRLEDIPFVDEPEVNTCGTRGEDRAEAVEVGGDSGGRAIVVRLNPTSNQREVVVAGNRGSEAEAERSVVPCSALKTEDTGGTSTGVCYAEVTQMLGFRYVSDSVGRPIMPPGMAEYWCEAADDALDEDDIVWG